MHNIALKGDTALIPTSVAARIMDCSPQTVYRNLTPAVSFPNGQKLYAEPDAHAWKRRRKAPAQAGEFKEQP